MVDMVIAMRLRDFLRIAEREFEAVPAEFRRGVAGPVVVRRAKRHPFLPGSYTLGQCVPVPDSLTLGDERLSTVFLWYGSFVACAMRDPGFRMEEEIRETVRHEIRHHIEDRAGAPDLRNEDAAEEQNERRLEGLPFHPDFYRLGEPAGDRLWRLHADLFLEVDLDRRALATALREGLAVRWGGRTRRLGPEALAALPAFFPIEGAAAAGPGTEAGDLVVVVRRR